MTACPFIGTKRTPQLRLVERAARLANPPSNSCTARRLPLRRQIGVALVRLSEQAPKTN